jgi:hypothetical protein
MGGSPASTEPFVELFRVADDEVAASRAARNRLDANPKSANFNIVRSVYPYKKKKPQPICNHNQTK